MEALVSVSTTLAGLGVALAVGRCVLAGVLAVAFRRRPADQETGTGSTISDPSGPRNRAPLSSSTVSAV